MDQTEICYLPAADLAAKVRAREVSPTEVVEAFLTRIDAVNPKLNAYVTIDAKGARAGARALEAAIERGEPVGPLAGVPVSIKDIIITKGIRTTRGSRLYADAVPTEDAPVVERLKAAGAIVLGKTNTPEFGWKASTDNQLFGPTRNPWKLDRTAGGSSGGAGAAVAAGLGPLAIGTDGGGSIRIPASFCGIFGLKATHGLVPVYPASQAEAVSHTGPMTRTVRDAALMLNAIAGYDPRDRNSYPTGNPNYLAGIGDGIAGLRVAWSPNLGSGTVAPEVLAATENAARRFGQLGCSVEDAAPEVGEYNRAWFLLFYGAVAAGMTSQPDGWEEKIDPGLLATIREARQASGVEVAQAYQTRARVFDVVRRFFERYDLLLTPSWPGAPWAVGHDFDPNANNLAQLTQLFNLTGQPAATVPCGWTSEGLPIGLQLVGRRHEDALVLRAAAAFEELAPWARRRPGLETI